MRQTLLSTVIYALLCASGIAGSNTLAAEETAHTFLITQTSRHDALIELATKSGREILFSYDATPKDKVDPFENALTLEDSLKKLLDGTDLRYTMTGNQIRIMRVGQEFSRLPPVTVLGYLRSSNKNITFNEDSQDRFPLYQVPLSIQSISDEYIEEIQAQDLDDVLTFINGVEYLSSAGGINPTYYSRGISTPFSIDGKFYRRSLFDIDPYILERIDLVQGPTANFLNPGGMLNFVTKKPHKKNDSELMVSRGSENFYRGAFDVNINKSEDEISAFRLVGAIESQDYFKEHSFLDRYIFSPSILHEFKNGSTLLVNGFYSYKKQTSNTTTIHDSLLSRELPRDRLLSAKWSDAKREEQTVAIDYTNLEWNNWRLNAGANWYLSNSNNSPTTIVSANTLIDPSDNTFASTGEALLFRFNVTDQEVRTSGLDFAGERNFDLGDMPILFRAGFDYQRFDINNPIYTDPTFGAVQFISFFNIYDPDYDIPEPAIPNATGKYKQITDFYGVVLSTSFYLTESATLHIDQRYEDMLTNIRNYDVVANVNQLVRSHYKEFTNNIGLNYIFNRNLASHISYSESFTHQIVFDEDDVDDLTFTTYDGDTVDPIKNRQFEFSLKGNWLDGSLNSNLTFYSLRVSNTQVAWTDGTNAYNTRLKDQTSRGASLNISGNLSDSVKLITNAAFNDSEALIGTPTFTGVETTDGLQVPSTAKFVTNTWISYDSKSGAFKDYEFGIGVKYVGDRYGDAENTFRLDSYNTVQAALRYSGYENVEIALIIKNMFDVDYYKGSLGSATLIEEGEPLTFYLTLKSKHNF